MLNFMSKSLAHSFASTRKILQGEKLLFAFWRAESKEDSGYQHWYLPLKKIFGKVIVFDTSKNYFRYGRDVMNERLLEYVKIEKPDYIFFDLVYDEISIETILEVRRVAPNAKTINLYADDDWRYEDFSRFYAPFFDYSILTQDEGIMYKHDGIKNVFFLAKIANLKQIII